VQTIIAAINYSLVVKLTGSLLMATLSLTMLSAAIKPQLPLKRYLLRVLLECKSPLDVECVSNIVESKGVQVYPSIVLLYFARVTINRLV